MLTFPRFVHVVAVQAGLDTAKWIDGDDCSGSGIAGKVGDLEDINDFNLVYFESTGFTAQTIAFPGSEIGGPYALCCKCKYTRH